jgi:carbon storage regulator CsrA
MSGMRKKLNLSRVGGLCLSRRVGEELRIGDAIVQVIGVDGGNVRLRIAAPATVEVLRGELLPAGWAERLRSEHFASHADLIAGDVA